VKTFDLVVAADLEGGIGLDGQLPWKLSQDMKYFKELTSNTEESGAQNAVIMGRKTWESIPEKRRPLSGRLNVVLTRSSNYEVPTGVLVCASLDEAMAKLSELNPENCFVIGGGEIYRQALTHQQCRRIYLTEIRAKFKCDTTFPEYQSSYEELSASPILRENDLEFCFKVFARKAGGP